MNEKAYGKILHLSKKSLKYRHNVNNYYLNGMAIYKAIALYKQKHFKGSLTECNKIIEFCSQKRHIKQKYLPSFYQVSNIHDFFSAIKYKHSSLFGLNQLKECYLLSIYIDKFINYSIHSTILEESKMDILANTQAIYATTIDICVQLNKPTDAYYFMERSRAVLLEESLRKASKNNADTTFLSLKQLQSKLKNDQTFLSYFVGDSSIYAFWTDKNTSHLKKLSISHSKYEQLSNDFLVLCRQDATQNGHISDTMMKNIQQKYPTIAYQLYKVLFEPLGIKPNSRVIVSSNDALLPFAALMKSDKDFNTNSYLLHDYCFSYAYSANLLFNAPNLEKPTIEKQLLTIYPKNYGDDASGQNIAQSSRPEDNNLLVLASNKLLSLEEKGSIATIRGDGYWGKVLSEIAATKANFLRDIKDTQIAYFFTHAQANNGTEPSIYFQKDSLTLKEIYSLQGKIATELVCFAACETGIGKKEQGEGVMSLARGFAYAGVPASTTTLWSVFSSYTDELYKGFFEKMSQNKDKDIALQASQIAFLKNGSIHAQLPVSWAGLVLVGNSTPILPQSPSYTWIGGGFALTLVGIGWLVYFLFKRRYTF